MRNKRGISQIDWVISLAVFLLYLAWFFVYLNPIKGIDSKEDVIESVRSSFIAGAEWSVDQYPLFVKIETPKDDFPVVVRFPFALTKSFGMQHYYVLDDDYLIFLADLDRGTNDFIISISEDDYPKQNKSPMLMINNDSVSSSRIKVNLNDVFIDSIELNNFSSVENIEVKLNNVDVGFSNYSLSFANSSIHYRRKLSSEFLNISTLVFDSRIKNMIRPNYAANLSRYEFYFNGKVRGYENYFSDNEENGNLEDVGCKTFNSSFIRFYNSNSSGLAFAISNLSRISICSENDELGNIIVDLKLEVPLREDSFIDLIFYKGNTSYVYDEPKFLFGADEKKTGFSMKKMQILSSKNLRDEFRISQGNDFSIRVVNSSSQDVFFDYGIAPGSDVNIFVKQFSCNVLDKFGSQDSCSMIVRSW